ncbi:hypothetical protein EXIGLDRAFT_772613 [Exidia glandulosa HHB12029]|uniref:Uncharacterized protein n=1 Tax=Exidia glandulosa HHB12029 TaxID=1314781 RepID=A0A165F8H5_EXIGL|nr:hypothetical protein EXIGLDRAFT_772613 [Exidia glandulosa HHB12029]
MSPTLSAPSHLSQRQGGAPAHMFPGLSRESQISDGRGGYFRSQDGRRGAAAHGAIDTSSFHEALATYLLATMRHGCRRFESGPLLVLKMEYHHHAIEIKTEPYNENSNMTVDPTAPSSQSLSRLLHWVL